MSWFILLAKYISAILFIPLVILILFIVQFLIGGIFFGYSSLNIPVVVYNLAEKQIETINQMLGYTTQTVADTYLASKIHILT